MTNLIIFGNREIASLARYYFENDSSHRVVAFTVDDAFIDEDSFEGLPVVPFGEVQGRFPPSSHGMHVALSYQGLNRLREEKYRQAREAGYALASYVCTKSVTWPDIPIGDNCFILENQTIQPMVEIGNNVMIWSGNHIGHGCILRDHVYIASHVCLSGHCDIGERSFLGVNATLKDFTRVGSDCFVAMDASVSSDLPDGAVALGSGATVFPAEDRRARVLKRQYFGE